MVQRPSKGSCYMPCQSLKDRIKFKREPHFAINLLQVIPNVCMAAQCQRKKEPAAGAVTSKIYSVKPNCTPENCQFA
jgi:hypothetical protein